jgi:hypothetical protein
MIPDNVEGRGAQGMGKARVNGTVRKLLGALACLTLSAPWPALAEGGAADEAIHDLPNPPSCAARGASCAAP